LLTRRFFALVFLGYWGSQICPLGRGFETAFKPNYLLDNQMAKMYNGFKQMFFFVVDSTALFDSLVKPVKNNF
jgi:hypothetical protein